MAHGIFFPQVVITPPKKKNDTRIISTNNLVVHYKLGNTDDAWFNNLDLTNNGSITFKRGAIDKVAKLDTSPQRLTRAHTTLLNPKIKDYTWVVHFRGAIDEAAESFPRLISKMAGGNSIGYRLYMSDTVGDVRIEVDDGTTNAQAVLSNADYLDGKEHIAIATMDRTGLLLKIMVDSRDNSAQVAIPGGVGSIAGTLNYSLGDQDDSPVHQFFGEIGEVRQYERILTAAEQDILFRAKTRYIIGTEEQGGSIKCKQMEPSSLNIRINGQDALFRDLYQPAGQVCVLHDVVSLDKLRAWYSFHTLDDESLKDNDLTLNNSPRVATIKLDGDLLDSVGSNNGTLGAGTEQYVKDVADLLFKRGFKKSFDFDGSSYVSISDFDEFNGNGGTELSVFARFKRAAGPTGDTIVAHLASAGNQRAWVLQFDGSDHLRAVVYDTGASAVKKIYDTPLTYDDSLWHNFGFTWSSGTLKIFVDGVEITPVITEDDAMTTIHNSTAEISIGSQGGGANPITGQVSKVDVFSSALTATQVKAIFENDSSELAKDGGLLSGVGDHYTAIDSESLNLSKKRAFTIVCKVLAHPETAQRKTVWVKTNDMVTITQAGYGVNRVDPTVPANARFRFSLQDGTNQELFDGPLGGFPDDKEIFYAVRYNGNEDRSGITLDTDAVKTTFSAAAFNLAAGDIMNLDQSLGFGGGTRSGAFDIKFFAMWDRELTDAEILDLRTLTRPKLACLFDGIIMDTPTDRKTNTPFNIIATDYLYDRLNNEALTRAYPGDQDVGDIMADSVTKTSLLDDFINTDIDRLRVSSLGKYFIRESMLNVFKWATKAGGSVFYSKRRGSNRYIFHHKINKMPSGLTLTKSNIRGKPGSTLYKSGTSLHDTATSVEVEGGVINTEEETQTFDNGTNKATDTLYYAFKVTPEFIRYGQLELKMYKEGEPSPLRIEIREDKAGDPAGPEAVELASVILDPTDVPAAAADAEFIPVDFDILLDTGKTYWVTIFINGDATNRYHIKDNGGTVDTSTETSPDDITWTPVGYTLVYKWSRKEPILSLAKNSTLQQEVKVRKLVFKDDEITDKDTARIIARGILERVGKKQVYIQGLKVKGINIVPIPGESLIFNDDLLGFNSEQVEVQQVKTMMRLGKVGAIDQIEFVIGDKIRDPALIFTDFLAAFRNSLTSDQQVVTDTRINAENQPIGVLATGVRVPPIKQSQDIGLDGIIVVGDPPDEVQLLPAAMLWDHDDVDPANIVADLPLSGHPRDTVGTNHGTWTGNEKYAQGFTPQSKVADLDGASHIVLANEANFDREINQAFSVVIAMKPLTGIVNLDILFVKDANINSGAGGYGAFHGGVDTITFRISDGTTLHDVNSTSGSVPIGKFVFLVFTKAAAANRSSMKIYVNKVLNATGAAQAMSGTALNANAFRIGKDNQPREPFALMGDFKFFNSELSQAQIDDLFEAWKNKYDLGVIDEDDL